MNEQIMNAGPLSEELRTAVERAASSLETAFPGSRGMISVCDNDDGILHRVAQWGAVVTCDPAMHRKNCRIVNVASRDMLDSEDPMHCPRTSYPHLCQPLQIQGRLAGCIHLGFGGKKVTDEEFARGREQLAVSGIRILDSMTPLH